MAITVGINDLDVSDEIKKKLNNLAKFDSTTDDDIMKRMLELEKLEEEDVSIFKKMKLASKMQLQKEHGLALAVGEDPEMAESITKGRKLLDKIADKAEERGLMKAFTNSLYGT